MKLKGDMLRYKLGILCVILSFVSPLVALMIPFLNLSIELTATLATVFFVGLPEFFLLIGAVLAGKKAFQTLILKIRQWLGRE